MKELVFFILGVSLSFQLFAGSVNNAKVLKVRIDKTGLGMVFFNVDLSSPPACVTNPAYSSVLAFDTNTAGGKSVLAILLSAQVTGSNISATGTGTCTLYTTPIEDWNFGFYLTP